MMSSAFTRRLCVAVAIGLLAVCGSAQAALLWYDGISRASEGGDYIIGDNNVAGQSGGTGTFFNNPWVPSTSWAVEHSIRPKSLHRYMKDSSVSAQIYPSVGSRIGDTVNPAYPEYVGRDFRAFASPWGGDTAPVGTYYFGFLATWGTGPVLHHRALEMYNGDIGSDDYRVLQLGYSEWTGLGTSLSLAVDGETGGAVVDTLSENVNFIEDKGAVHFIVLKFDMKESDFDPGTTEDNDVVSVYLDPVGTVEPGTASAQVSVDDFVATHMSAITNFVWGAGTEKSTGLDELRVGTAFADVANNLQAYYHIPEPASMVLIGLGMLGLLAVRRK
jgi:hypothetical protein